MPQHRTNLKYSQQCYSKSVEVGKWCFFWEVEGATEQLHPQECKDEDEQEEQEQERDDGAHRAQQ